MTLIFDMEVDLDPTSTLYGIKGQGRRARSNVEILFLSLLSENEVEVTKIKVKFECQGLDY